MSLYSKLHNVVRHPDLSMHGRWSDLIRARPQATPPGMTTASVDNVMSLDLLNKMKQKTQSAFVPSSASPEQPLFTVAPPGGEKDLMGL